MYEPSVNNPVDKRKRKRQSPSPRPSQKKRSRNLEPTSDGDDDDDKTTIPTPPSTPDEMMVLLNPPLTQEQRTKVEEMGAIEVGMPSLADIPVGPTLPNNVRLTPHDHATLNPGQWLNDEVVNGFLSIL